MGKETGKEGRWGLGLGSLFSRGPGSEGIRLNDQSTKKCQRFSLCKSLGWIRNWIMSTVQSFLTEPSCTLWEKFRSSQGLKRVGRAIFFKNIRSRVCSFWTQKTVPHLSKGISQSLSLCLSVSLSLSHTHTHTHTHTLQENSVTELLFRGRASGPGSRYWQVAPEVGQNVLR